mmetsp:Transcript_114362/g.262460  ORF Transcript_114362/g.262460 Transcript_114362/m.262460 type:complete len:156 (-) Transcript_114362:226-693(-)
MVCVSGAPKVHHPAVMPDATLDCCILKCPSIRAPPGLECVVALAPPGLERAEDSDDAAVSEYSQATESTAASWTPCPMGGAGLNGREGCPGYCWRYWKHQMLPEYPLGCTDPDCSKCHCEDHKPDVSEIRRKGKAMRKRWERKHSKADPPAVAAP